MGAGRLEDRSAPPEWAILLRWLLAVVATLLLAGGRMARVRDLVGPADALSAGLVIGENRSAQAYRGAHLDSGSSAEDRAGARD